MKFLLKKMLLFVARSGFLWATLGRPLQSVAKYLARVRAEQLLDMPQLEKIIFEGGLEVKHGPFRGMKYPERAASGSVFYPKILGSYERELHPVIEHSILKNTYAQIVDIGCAEGYYAVGLARRFPGARIYAFDIDANALSLAKTMAKLNSVENQIVFDDFCSGEKLSQLINGTRSLLVCDCEGYEKELFTTSRLSAFAQCDILVETHDILDISISTAISKLFEKTHAVTRISSISDTQKAILYNYPDLTNLDLASRRYLLAERRADAMDWLFMQPLTGVGSQEMN